MKTALRTFFLAFLMTILVVLAACTNTPKISGGGGGGGGGTGSYTIGGTVSGLTGTGLVLKDNGSDALAITGNGSFTFATSVKGAYLVTISTQPTGQTCTLANFSGTATANVTNVQVTCTTGTSGPFTIGGSVSGLAGTGQGLTLLDNGGDSLIITGNGAFTFKTPITGGYDVTISTQPTNPAQTCAVTNPSGTATANITSVQVICQSVFFTIGGQVVGLVGTNSGMVLQDNGGDNLPVSGNGPFTFATPLASGSYYDVDVFVAPSTQPQGTRIYFYQGQALADVTSVVVDGGHNDWAFIAGAKTANQKGLSSPPTSFPITSIVTSSPGGARYPATWTDINGNLWLFGGVGYSTNTAVTYQPWWFQELWEYQGTGLANYQGSFNQYWTMVNENATPAGRWGAVTWTDAGGTQGRLWLFGGQDQFSEFLNELWVYDIGAQTWTLVSGGANESGTYGTQGTPGGYPGGRWGAAFRQDPTTGTVWMFGGYGYAAGATPGLLNDLWKYSGGQWTWVSGSNAINPDGVYGTLGTPAASNVPGGRQASVGWVDKSGNFWVFGGYIVTSTGEQDAFNDLWEFSGGQWTWVSGSSTVNQVATYGTKGVPATANVPGARWSPAAWTDTDTSGNTRLWLFGGHGYDSTGIGTLGDLWEFTPNQGGTSQNQWTWMKGPNAVNQAGVYGLAPTPIIWPYGAEGITGNPPNSPGARWGAGYWVDQSGQFWLFGGEGYDSTGSNGDGYLNDLWRYLPYPD